MSDKQGTVNRYAANQVNGVNRQMNANKASSTPIGWVSVAQPTHHRFWFALKLIPMMLAYGNALAQVGITNLGTLGGAVSRAESVSADGSAIAGFSEDGSGNLRAFRWTAGAGMVDLGTLGGSEAEALGISANGAVVVGRSSSVGSLQTDSFAFRWTSGTGMVNLGTLGGTGSRAVAASADGSVVAGSSDLDPSLGGGGRAFRWTSATGMVNIGTLAGGDSQAQALSADGTTVVGVVFYPNAALGYEAFRWTSGSGMVGLGTFGGITSTAYGVSADGSVVVGWASDGVTDMAFRWTSASGLVNIDTQTIPGSQARGVSADGSVVVGFFGDPNAPGFTRAFRWTQATGMQSVEDWLRASGVTVPANITYFATGTNADGSVVVGDLESGSAFVARAGSGLMAIPDLQGSLEGAAVGGDLVLSMTGQIFHGAHGRPLMRRVQAGRGTFWTAGDWGTDGHGNRQGPLGLAEVGWGTHWGTAQINLSLGQVWAHQRLPQNGSSKASGAYWMAEALIPINGPLWGVLGLYQHQGHVDVSRGYVNAGLPDQSRGRETASSWGVRARLEWDQAWRAGDTLFSPYADLSYRSAKLHGYTESGGGFPARFESRQEKATELRWGMNLMKPIGPNWTVTGLLEATHRLERNGARTQGDVIGLFGFSLGGPSYARDWLRLGMGLEGRVADGRASLMLNTTSRGETPSAWLAINWQKTF